MRHFIIALGMLACTGSLLAQIEQPIEIKEYNGKDEKYPLQGVNVTVVNAGGAMTDLDGNATLRFRTLHAGDKVTVRRIEKAGYEVFNTQALEQWTISDKKRFQIILCESKRFQALRDKYYRVASDSYAKQYKAAQARLAAERNKTKMLEEAYQQKLINLENEYQQQLEDLENYVDQFARIDLSELNRKQQELVDLVKAGKIEQAIEKYESADYQAQYAQQCQEIAKIDKAQAQLAVVEAQKRSEREKVYQTIERQIATYRLAGGRENFDKVTALLKSVADADTTQLEAVIKYAEHALHQRMTADAEKYYYIYIRGCASEPVLQADGWKMLGQGYALLHEFDKAEAAYLKAMEIDKKLYAEDANRFTPALLFTQEILSQQYLWKGDIAQAETILMEAINIAEGYFENNEDASQERLAYLYNSLSLTKFYTSDTQKAIAVSKKAGRIAKELYEKEEKSLPLILVLDRQAQLCYMSEQWEEFINTEKEYVDLNEKLYKKNPQRHSANLQSGYNNLADGHLHTQAYTECEEFLLKSEKLLNEMIEKEGNPHNYDKFNLYDIAVRLYQALGNAEKKASYLNGARESFQLMTPEEQAQNQELMNSLEKL